MPTPRTHGGAATALIPMTIPGFRGLNTQQSTSILGHEWATLLQNAVIDDSSRLSSRKGWTNDTTVAAAQKFKSMAHFLTHAGVEYVIASGATALYASADAGANWTDVTNAIAFTSGNWQFVNFNDKIYGIQSGEALIYSTGGNFTQSGVASVPSGNCLLSAFGRLWASASDGFTLQYSALLNADDWSGTDAGNFDLKNVWSGTDTIQALAEFNGSLVVFGKRHIVIYSDGQGSALGMDPSTMYVVDIISGTGCIARDSVQNVDGDLWFLSDNGLQSLGRLLTQKSNPLENLSKPVQDYLRDEVAATTASRIRSVYSAKNRLYLLSLPDGVGGGITFAWDTRGKLEDGSARCMGEWNLVPECMSVSTAGVLQMAIYSVTGKIGHYAGYTENTTAIAFDYESGWIDLTQAGFLTFPKRLEGIFFLDANTSLNFKWAFDFETEFKTAPYTFTVTAAAVYGTGVWGTALWGGGVSLRRGKVPGNGSGEYIKVGISGSLTASTVAIHQLGIFAKVGRYA